MGFETRSNTSTHNYDLCIAERYYISLRPLNISIFHFVHLKLSMLSEERKSELMTIVTKSLSGKDKHIFHFRSVIFAQLNACAKINGARNLKQKIENIEKKS